MLPPLWPDVLSRERLLASLDEAIEQGRHVGLFAGTGNGKTTLLAMWARNRPTAWLTLDAEDADLDTFLGYLIAALERAVPGFTTEARDLLGRAREREGAHAALATLLADLDEQCDHPLVLVLDEYHLAASPSLDALLGRLYRYLPACVRLVVAARKPPELEISTLQAARRVEVFTERELAFDLEELRALRPGQSEEALGELLASTGGLPAAMGLRPELLEAYLDEQLLAHLPAELRAFVDRLCLVEHFDARLCEEALGAPLTRERREALLRERLILVHGPDRYMLHPALRQLLFRRFLANAPRDERHTHLIQVGTYYWRSGQAATGLRFWIDAGEAAWAAEQLAADAPNWLAAGRLDALASAIDALGAEADRPELVVIEGELHRRWGDFVRADGLFARAAAAFEARGECRGVALARLGEAQVAASRGDVALARERLAVARPVLEADPPHELDILNLEGGLALLGGDTEAAIARFEGACELARRLGDRYAEARALHNLGICFIRGAEFDRALACYDAGLATSPAESTPLVWMTPINRALVLMHLGKMAEAEAAAEAVLAMVRRYHLTREEGYALRILGVALMRRGAFEASRGCFDAAEHLARKGNDTLGVAYSLNFRAELAVEEGDVASALALVDEVARVLGGPDAAFGILEFAHIRATVALAAGQLAEAEGMIEALLGRARRDGYKKVERETERLAEQLARLRRGEESVQVAREPVVLAAPPELRIQCFGGLRVFREDGEITDREWRTTRSKLLLIYLLFNREGATKSQLLDMVFTGEEVSNDLMNMTLVRLRKALEPELQKGQPSRYVLRLDGRYSFNHQARIQLDTQEFEHLPRAATLAGGETERVLLERALAIYTGEFLPEFDVPWVATLRHRFEALALEVCRRLLVIYDAQEPTLSIALLQRALEIDPLCEAFNRELIKRFLETDQHQRALRHYQLCELHYRERLSSAPPSDLVELLSRG